MEAGMLTDTDWLIVLVGTIIGTIVLVASIYWASKWKWKRIDLKKAKKVVKQSGRIKRFEGRLARFIDI